MNIISTNKTSQAQLKATAKYKAKNKTRVKYIQYRSYSRTFINKIATLEDLYKLKEQIEQVILQKYSVKHKKT